MADHVRRVRFDQRFLRRVDELVAQGHEHAEAARIARGELGIRPTPDESWATEHRERHGRMGEAPKRVTRG